MRFTSIKKWLWDRPALALSSAAALLYLPWLGLADLATDEAKSALNIAYPHPPLMRWLMAGSQAFLGTNAFAVRLPVVLFGAAGVGVMFLLLEQLFGNRKQAVLGAIIFGLLPAWVTFSRSGYLSVPLAVAALVMLLGIARTSDRPDDALGHRLVFLGLTIGLWSELQGLLLVPVWTWWVWNNRTALRQNARALAYVLLGAGQIVAFGLYILSSPQILADTFSFARNTGGAIHQNVVTTVLHWLSPASGQWTIAVVILLVLAFRFRRTQIRQTEGAALTMLAALFILLCFARPTGYYAPYLVAVAVPLGVLVSTRLEAHLARTTGVAVAVVCLLLLPLAYVASSSQTFLSRNAGEFALALKGEHNVMVLGDTSVGINGGYALQFYLPVSVTTWPEDSNRQLSRTVLVFHPQSLTEKEKTVLQGLQFDRLIGPVAVYRVR